MNFDGIEVVNSVLIVGCGYIGRQVGEKWIKRGVPVTGLVSSEASVESLRGTGITVLQSDLDTGLSVLPTEDALIYYFVPPPGNTDIDTRMRKFVSILKANKAPEHLILISTTGVYGDAGGQWVTEDSTVQPGTDRAKRRLDAEAVLSAWSLDSGVVLVILRVGGIYGPGRLPVRFLSSGQALPPVDDSPYTNRIHADDLADVCVAAAHPGFSPGIYNATDGQPMRMVDYFHQVADFLGMEQPPSSEFGAAMEKLSPAMQAYLSESRRICNQKLLSELGSGLKYPSIKEGLPSCVTPDLAAKTVSDSTGWTRETA